jgi:hypothetical protein
MAVNRLLGLLVNGAARRAVLAGAGVVLGMGSTASAAFVIANDGFETDTHPTGFRTVAVASPVPGNNGIRFFTVKDPNAASASITNDVVLGSNALVVNNTPNSTSFPIVGNLPLFPTLNNVNDNVTLTFRFRFLNAPTSAPSNSAFRFGIYSSNGTPVTGDNQIGASDNDQGYYVQIGDADQVVNNLFYRESGGTSPILGGTDRSTGNASAGVAGITDTNAHTAAFSITRTDAATYRLALSIDGGTPVTMNAGTPYTQFDQIAFSNGFGNPAMNFAIDDVRIEATAYAIPEPASLSLAAIGAIGLLARRRRVASR